jgi:hypothetical protein
LDFNGKIHRIDDATELDNCAVAGALDDPAVMDSDDRIDQVASERPQTRQNPVLIGSGKARLADDVGHQDRGEFPGLAHSANPSDRQPPPFLTAPARSEAWLALPCCAVEDVEAGAHPRVSAREAYPRRA